MNEQKKKILVVDDQPGNRKLLNDLLKFKGYDIIEASDGKEALKNAEKHPDLILLDINMPDISGYEVAKQLKSKDSTKNIPFIMLTAQEDKQSVDAAFAAGAVDYIVKPFQPANLLQKIIKALG
ncbi:MAG: response regulator [Candidatus Saganbacteria bacterium]|nr:response regulator [Candidatus Saganbacteria bacterium]